MVDVGFGADSARVAGSQTPIFRLPGVYRPQEDTAMLVAAVDHLGSLRGLDALDLCTGNGAAAVAVAGRGPRSVTAVDLSARSVWSARLNAALAGRRIRALRGDLYAPVSGHTFDLVTANPPYIPAGSDALPRHTSGRCWDGGLDGRTLVDRICRGAIEVLRPGGSLLLVHSHVTGEDRTATLLADSGLDVEVVGRCRLPFGPVMRARRAALTTSGHLAAADFDEGLVVFRARRPTALARAA